MNSKPCAIPNQLQKVSWQFFMLYFDETNCCISPDFTSPIPLGTLPGDLEQVGT